MLNTQTKAKKNSNLDNINFEKIFKNLNYMLIQPLVEFWAGLKSGRLPLFECMLISCGLQIILLMHWDVQIFRWMYLRPIYPSQGVSRGVYRAMVYLFPFWGWGFYQVILKIKLIKKLTQTFLNSGLKSLTGRLPAFIFDRPIDEFTRRLRLQKSGMSLCDFQGAKENIESNLQVFIDEVTEERRNGTVDIVYSHKELEKEFIISDFKDLRSDSFIIGKGRSSLIYGNLIDTPHLMVAGQTGMGKSTYLRQLITSLYVKNKGYSFQLIDLKEGLEFQIFQNLPRVKVRSDVSSAAILLEKLCTETIKVRGQLLKENGCKDISAFLKIPKDKRKFPKGVSREISLDREIVVIDEAFDLFMVGAFAGPNQVQKTRRYASKVAAQGRAVGVHIVIATQRPDRFAIDPQTKANLNGKVCFRVANIASSLTAVDSKRAAELPNIKGRAIWKDSSETTEIQTPLFAEDKAVAMLTEYYRYARKEASESEKSKVKLKDSQSCQY